MIIILEEPTDLLQANTLNSVISALEEVGFNISFFSKTGTISTSIKQAAMLEVVKLSNQEKNISSANSLNSNFDNPLQYPYLSVVNPETDDLPKNCWVNRDVEIPSFVKQTVRQLATLPECEKVIYQFTSEKEHLFKVTPNRALISDQGIQLQNALTDFWQQLEQKLKCPDEFICISAFVPPDKLDRPSILLNRSPA